MSALLLKKLVNKKIIENIADIIVYYVRTHNHKWYITQMGYWALTQMGSNQYGIPSDIKEKHIDKNMTFSNWLHDFKPESGTDVPLLLLKRRKWRRKWSLKDTITLYDRIVMFIDITTPVGKKEMESVFYLFYLFTATDNAIFAYMNEIDYSFDLGDQRYCDEKYYEDLDWKTIKKEEVNVFLIMVTNACRRYPKLMTLLTSDKLISDEIFDKIFEKNLSVLKHASMYFKTKKRLKRVVKEDFRLWQSNQHYGKSVGWVQILVASVKLKLESTTKEISSLYPKSYPKWCHSIKDTNQLSAALLKTSQSGHDIEMNNNHSPGSGNLLQIKPLIF